jgi:hypothetical protein
MMYLHGSIRMSYRRYTDKDNERLFTIVTKLDFMGTAVGVCRCSVVVIF